MASRGDMSGQRTSHENATCDDLGPASRECCETAIVAGNVDSESSDGAFYRIDTGPTPLPR